jgi:hypothetical protein
MSDFWSVLMALLALVLPLGLAWLLLGCKERKRASVAAPRNTRRR